MSWRKGGEARREATEFGAVVFAVAGVVVGFVYLPTAVYYGVLYTLAGLVFAVAPPANAYAKGFRWWLWVFPNLICWIVVFALPSARDPDVSAETRAHRARVADRVGVALTVLSVAGLLCGLVREVTGWW
jgi:hypothetical protein